MRPLTEAAIGSRSSRGATVGHSGGPVALGTGGDFGAGANEMITRIRPHLTRSGKAMGFVTIEDVQGSVELVIFPKTWERVSEMVSYDKIVLVDGRLDAQGAEPKVLVDKISTDFTVLVSNAGTPPVSPSVDDGADTDDESDVAPYDEPDFQSSSGIDPEEDEAQIPPPPDSFPEDWGASIEPVEPLKASSQSAPVSVDLSETQENPEAKTMLPAELPERDELDKLTSTTRQYLVSPVTSGEAEVVHMITVVLRTTGDRTRDVLRMRRIHGTAMSYPGSDRFAFHVFEKGHGYLVEFPNFTTGLCPDLLAKLKLLAGSDSVRVEPITFL